MKAPKKYDDLIKFVMKLYETKKIPIIEVVKFAEKCDYFFQETDNDELNNNDLANCIWRTKTRFISKKSSRSFGFIKYDYIYS